MYLTFDAAELDPVTGAATDPALRRRLERWAERFLAHVERHPRG
jgi:hypothetical protein